MSRWISLAAFALLASGCASDSAWEGKISDEVCSGVHDWDEHSAPLTEQECSIKCASAGAKYVLISEGQTYTLKPKDPSEAQGVGNFGEFAGRPVRVMGRLEATTITVSKVEFP